MYRPGQVVVLIFEFKKERKEKSNKDKNRKKTNKMISLFENKI